MSLPKKQVEIFLFYGIINYKYVHCEERRVHMFGNGRKTIGVILCDVSSHYQEQICQTLSTYAREADYNLAYFTFYSCYGTEVTRNGRGEANIVYLIPFEKWMLSYCVMTHWGISQLWNIY